MESKKPKKAKKKFYTAKMHERQKSLGANLSKELRKSLKKRSLSVRKEDKVKVMRGKHKKKSGKIIRINRNKLQVFVDGIKRKKADGTEIFVPIHPSNLLLIELVTDDKKRKVTGAAKIKKPEEKKDTKKEVKKEVEKKEIKKEVLTVKNR